jgi:hypothetical protein
MHKFDFLFGRWNVRNRRLRNPLTGSDDWYEFDSTASETPLLDGMGNLEQWDAPEAPTGPIHAVALRLFNAETAEWSIYWSTRGSGIFNPPVSGSFEGGVGTFVSREDYNGQPIVVRFTWSPIDETSARWEQAFSADDGATWEVNWIMDFSR